MKLFELFVKYKHAAFFLHDSAKSELTKNVIMVYKCIEPVDEILLIK